MARDLYVANWKRPRFHPSQAHLTAVPQGGVAFGSIATDTTDAGVSADGEPLSNVDPANEMVRMKLDRRRYEANAAVVGMADSMVGDLLNVMLKRDS